jgi:dephospho-CoA kinase
VAEVAITGGIGSGKTTVATLLVAEGAVLVDADQIVKDLQKPGGKVFVEIVQKYGRLILLEDGNLDRQKIAEIVFNDQEELLELNAIVHPAVGEEMGKQRKEAIKSGKIVLVDIPLMVTLDGKLGRDEYELFDGIIVVDCKIEVAISRLVSYRDFSEKDAEARIGTQATPEQRRKYADFIIDNNGPEEDLSQQIEACWKWMRSLSTKDPDR